MNVVRAVITLTILIFFSTFPRLHAAPPPGYYLVWSDEFNQPSLNPTNWDYWLEGNWNDAVNTTNAVSMNSSNVVITTYNSGSTIDTAMLATDKSFSPRYGYWEANIQWGDTNGEWSAIWLRSPTMGTYLDDSYSSGGELDIAEHRYVGIYETNYIANIVSCNIHWNGYGSEEDNSGSPNVGTTLNVGFHTYGLLWTTNSYIFDIDNSEVWDGSSVTPSFGSGAFLILSSEVSDTSTTWAGYIPTGGYPSQAASNVKYAIDYVHYYAPTNDLFWTGGASAYWNNPANWVSNMSPTSISDLTFSTLSSTTNVMLGQNYSVDGLVFLNSFGAFSINGANTLTLGAGGVDMVPANYNVTLNTPMVIGANQTWSVGPNHAANILLANGNLVGSATLTKARPGTLVLNGTNSFSGILNVDTGNVTNDGAILIANPAAIAHVAAVQMRNTGTGHSTLQLSNNTVVPALVSLAGRSTNVVAIESLAGNNQLANGLTLTGGGANYLIQSDSGSLTLGGVVSTGGSANSPCQLTLQGNGAFSVSGSIQNGTTSLSVLKTNNGALIFNGTLAGGLTVAGGTLAGTGTITGNSVIQSGVELSPGNAVVNAIGTLTFGGSLVVSPGGTNYLELNAGLNTNDQVVVGGTLTCGGTLCVTNLGGDFVLNQSFQLFKAQNIVGSFSSITLPLLDGSLAWATNQLGQGIVSVIANTNPPQILVNLPGQTTVAEGKPYTYAPVISTPQPTSYQWYNGTTPIAGATNATYTPPATFTGTSTYWLAITNNFGVTTSSAATYTSIAPPSGSYSGIVLGLNPAGYWPLQETNAPASVAMETNYGTLGALGNAYYSATNASAVAFAESGALTGDPDPAAAFGISQASFAIVPRLTPKLTLVAPFSLEAWVNPSNTTYGVIIGEGGGAGLNGAKTFGGFQFGFGSSEAQVQYYTGGNNTFKQYNSPANYPAGAWYHVVLTYDGTNSITYVNGIAAVTGTSTYVPDTNSPLSIGNGKWNYETNGPTRHLAALIDEVAVYTNRLSAGRVSTHYNAGLNPAAYGAYLTNILADRPLLYYRMDCAGYTNTPFNSCPLAMNFGFAPVNGAYLSGIAPGALTGPVSAIFQTNNLATPINGLISCVDAGYDPSFNPTGNQAFTAMTWMRTFPADTRQQTIMSHGATNWTLDLNGNTGYAQWRLANGSLVTSTSILNDGNWHFLAGVYDGATSYLYVDGTLNAFTSATGGIPGETNADLLLGGNADYTQQEVNQQYFAGALAHAAFFTNALSAAQIHALYNGVSPQLAGAQASNNGSVTYTGRLLYATNVAGPYLPVPAVPFTSSPTNYLVSPMGGPIFFRSGGQ